MYLNSLLDRISEDLSSSFCIPIKVEQYLKGESDTHLRVFETQSQIQMGFVIDLEWRRINLHSEPHFVIADKDNKVISIWKDLLERNRNVFVFFVSELTKANCTIKYDFNHIESDSLIFPQDCSFFSVKCRSGFLPVRNNMDFNYDSFRRLLTDFWGLVLSFSSNLDEACSEFPLEGDEKEITSKKYERNPIYREICLSHFGYKCQICGCDLSECYGEIAEHFIEVHHINPLYSYDSAKRINPITDLLPVCPNCHAMLHRKKPPYKPQELKEMLIKENVANVTH